MSIKPIQVSVSVAAICIAAGLCLAQNQPSPGEPGEPGHGGRQIDRGFPDRSWGLRRREISEDEWQAVSNFMAENFPNRWAVYQNVISAPGREMLGREMKIRIVGRYRQLERVRQNNEGLYEVAVEQAKADDQVWGSVRAWRELAENASASERESVLEKMKQDVRTMLLKTFDERQTRLASIRDALAREEKELESDRKRVDKLVESRVETLTSDNPFRGPDGLGPLHDRQGIERAPGDERPEGGRRGPGHRSDRRGGPETEPDTEPDASPQND